MGRERSGDCSSCASKSKYPAALIMKRSGATVAVASSAAALVVAASYSAALSDSFSDPKFQSPSQPNEREEQRRLSPAADRFAPRFDGLRFIETLVTAHR